MTDATPRPPSSGRNQAALVLLLVALLGGIAGVAFDRLLLLPRMARGGPGFGHGPRNGHHPGPNPMRERFSHALDLTPDQRVRVDSIMARQRQQMDAVRREVQPRMDSSMAETRRAIDSVLTPEQRKKAESLFRRMPGSDGHGFRMPPPGGPGGPRDDPPPPP